MAITGDDPWGGINIPTMVQLLKNASVFPMGAHNPPAHIKFLSGGRSSGDARHSYSGFGGQKRLCFWWGQPLD